jgi:hypothetical protein
LAEAGHQSNEAEDDHPGNCEGVVGIPFGTDPSWVRVGGNTLPDAPFVRANAQILDHNTGDTSKPNPFVTNMDVGVAHWSMDFNAFLTLDADSRHLLANGNFADSFSLNERGILEVEWERGGFPVWAFPEENDRITVWGAHIWDCGHGDT